MTVPPDEPPSTVHAEDRGAPKLAAAHGESLRRSAAISAVALVVLAVIASIAALQHAEAFAAPTVLAGLLAIALAPAARALERIGAPRGLTAVVLVIVAIGAIAAALYVLLPSADALSARAPQIARDIERMAREFEAEISLEVDPDASMRPPLMGMQEEPAAEETDGEDSDDEPPGLFTSGRRLVTDTALQVPSLAAGAVYALFLSFFLLAGRETVGRTILAMVRTKRLRLMVGRGMRDVRRQVGAYLLAISAINVCLGATVGLVFWGLGMPNPVAWGAAMTLLNFMPYLGPIVMNLLVIAVGLTALPQPQDVIAPVVALIALNTIEGYGITPNIVGRQIRLGGMAVFVAIAFGAWLWGAAGALIATPTLIVMQAFLRRSVAMRAAQRRLSSTRAGPRLGRRGSVAAVAAARRGGSPAGPTSPPAGKRR